MMPVCFGFGCMLTDISVSVALVALQPFCPCSCSIAKVFCYGQPVALVFQSPLGYLSIYWFSVWSSFSSYFPCFHLSAAPFLSLPPLELQQPSSLSLLTLLLPRCAEKAAFLPSQPPPPPNASLSAHYLSLRNLFLLYNSHSFFPPFLIGLKWNLSLMSNVLSHYIKWHELESNNLTVYIY